MLLWVGCEWAPSLGRVAGLSLCGGASGGGPAGAALSLLVCTFSILHWIGNAGKLEQQLSLASQAAYEGSIPFARSKAAESLIPEGTANPFAHSRAGNPVGLAFVQERDDSRASALSV